MGRWLIWWSVCLTRVKTQSGKAKIHVKKKLLGVCTCNPSDGKTGGKEARSGHYAFSMACWWSSDQEKTQTKGGAGLRTNICGACPLACMWAMYCAPTQPPCTQGSYKMRNGLKTGLCRIHFKLKKFLNLPTLLCITNCHLN